MAPLAWPDVSVSTGHLSFVGRIDPSTDSMRPSAEPMLGDPEPRTSAPRPQYDPRRPGRESVAGLLPRYGCGGPNSSSSDPIGLGFGGLS